MNALDKEDNILTNCPVAKLVSVLSDTWTILILREILTSPKRFCELEKSLLGISTRTLTLKLQKLIDEEIIIHSDYYYSITRKGLKLKTVIKEIEKIAKNF